MISFQVSFIVKRARGRGVEGPPERAIATMMVVALWVVAGGQINWRFENLPRFISFRHKKCNKHSQNRHTYHVMDEMMELLKMLCVPIALISKRHPLIRTH